MLLKLQIGYIYVLFGAVFKMSIDKEYSLEQSIA